MITSNQVSEKPVILVTGSRTWHDRNTLYQALDDMLDTWGWFVLRHGAAPKGADHHAHDWAVLRQVDEDSMPAVWRVNGVYIPAAGFERNEAMVDKWPLPVGCLAFLDDCVKETCTYNRPHPSHGASHTVTLAKVAGIPVHPYYTQSQATAHD